MIHHHGPTPAALLAAIAMVAALPGCRKPHDPLAQAQASVGQTRNKEAQVPPACYTKTGGTSNPCWVCHTQGVKPNFHDDWELQLEYSFSPFALENRWTNLFDQRHGAAAITDQEILDLVRQDNYLPLQETLQAAKDQGRYPGFVPDLDFQAGFDEHGFARDGSGWRAFRYKPFSGTFWPTNGSTDDVLIRLPPAFRLDEVGRPSSDVHRANYEILEAAIARPPRVAARAVDARAAEARAVETPAPLPRTYLGGASAVAVQKYLYPEGTEFLHTVRYLDPDRPGFVAARMKEVRYARKFREIGAAAILSVEAEEAEKKERGFVAQVSGAPLSGYLNDFGWLLQGFIEDEAGRLRVQTEEEHRFCLGCHGNLGVTVDRTFAFARKVPGADGWRYQDLRGMRDVPQAGHADPEILTYLRRVGGGDEFRANEEMLSRFFPGGVLDETAVRRAAPGGTEDLTFLLLPSRERALALDKAYLTVVRQQRFDLGRETLLGPPPQVHRQITNGSTDLAARQHVFQDGVLWLDWGG